MWACQRLCVCVMRTAKHQREHKERRREQNIAQKLKKTEKPIMLKILLQFLVFSCSLHHTPLLPLGGGGVLRALLLLLFCDLLPPISKANQPTNNNTYAPHTHTHREKNTIAGGSSSSLSFFPSLFNLIIFFCALLFSPTREGGGQVQKRHKRVRYTGERKLV